MAIRDVVVLNTTASRLETQQSSDTVRIKGSSSELLSIENSSGTSVLSVNTVADGITITGNLTASGNFSGSLSTTASFGNVNVTNLVGSAAGLTNTDKDGTISGSAQIASDVSGSFTSGFNFTGNISGSSTSTGSFGTLRATNIVGDGSQLSNRLPPNFVTSSNQLATDISGSFDKGFEFAGTINKSVGAWSAGGSLIVARFGMVGAGTQNAALGISGKGSPAAVTNTEAYGGANWSETHDVTTARFKAGGGGTSTSAIFVGGNVNPGASVTGNSEEYGGSGWTEGDNLGTARRSMGSATPSQNSSLVFGGRVGDAAGVTCTEEYTGTSWNTRSALSTARYDTGGFGTVNAAVYTTGYSNANKSDTEEYDGSTWATSTPFPEVRYGVFGFGSLYNGLVTGGAAADSEAFCCISYEYNGTSWTAGGNLINAYRYTIGTGAIEAGLSIGGDNNPAGPVTNVQEYHGYASNTGSFGFLKTGFLEGDGSLLTNVTPDSSFSGSAQLRSEISGSFNKGFTFSGTISGSSTTTASMAILNASKLGAIDGGALTNAMPPNTLTSSAQIASDISGSHTSGFDFSGTISGSSTSTGSFGILNATTINADGSALSNRLPLNLVTGSKQLAADISGSHTSGFNFTGKISGSSTSTGSFGRLIVTKLVGDASQLTNIVPSNTVSSSVQLATDISGSFNKGFEFVGLLGLQRAWSNPPHSYNTYSTLAGQCSVGWSSIFGLARGGKTGCVGAWSSGATNLGSSYGSLVGTQNAALRAHYGSAHKYDGIAWSQVASLITSGSCNSGFGTQNAAVAVGGSGASGGGGEAIASSGSEEFNGIAWSETNDMNVGKRVLNAAGTQNAGIVYGGSTGSANTTATPSTETYDGTSYTVVGSMTLARSCSTGGIGNSENAMVIGGNAPACSNQRTGCVEVFDGASWSSGVISLSTTRQHHAMWGKSVNDASNIGGYQLPASPSFFPSIETFDGTTWTMGAPMITGRYAAIATGTTKAAIVNGGTVPGYSTSTNTEHYNENVVSASLGRFVATTVKGDGSDLTNKVKPGVVSSSVQLASDISGSHTGGFEFTNSITGVASTWASSGAMINTVNFGAGFGSQNAAVSTCTDKTEEYNGTSWSAQTGVGAAMSSSRECLVGVGTATAGLIFGGETVPAGGLADKSETFNGTIYAQTNTLNEARKALGGAGTATAALAFGGLAPGVSNLSEEFDGTDWSEGSEMGTARSLLGGAGSQNAALAIGGKEPGYSALTEEYGGTSWSAGTALPSARACLAAVGTQNATIVFGGNVDGSTILNTTVEYDGSAWAARGNLITAVQKHNSAGSNEAGLSFGGGPVAKGTEEYQAASVTSASFGKLVADTLKVGDISGLTNTYHGTGVVSSSAQMDTDVKGAFNKGFEFTGNIRTAKGAWSVGASPANGRHAQGAAGVQSAMLAGGGAYPGTNPAGSPNYAPHALSEEYNGSVWSETNDMITARAGVAGAGTQNAALFATGDYTTHTEEYNGTNYATGNATNQARQRGSGAGTQTAGLAAGGYHPNNSGRLADTELYDGAAWSNTADLNTARAHLQGGGSQNASIMIAGYSYPHYPVGINCTELWNGTTWTEVSGQVGLPSYSFSGGGTVNAATKTGGRFPNPISVGKQTERWDGVTWAIDTDLPANSRGQRSGGSTPSQHMTFGGDNSGPGAPGQANYEYNDYFTTGSFGEIQTDNLYIKQDKKLRATKSFQIPTFKVDPVTGSLVTGANASVGVSGSDAIADGKIPTPVGEVWFNSTDEKLKFTFGVNAWRASGNLINARAYAGGAGNSEAAIAVGGEPASADETTELYNGSAWSEDAVIDVPRTQLQATGQQNSALIFGGQQVASPNAVYDKTEAFNGTAWSEVNTLNKTRRLHYGLGTQNAALAASGRTVTPSSAIIADTEEWDGTSWYAAADINAAKGFGGAGGTQNAGIIFGGSTAHSTNTTVGQTETYDGTSWTERNDMIHARQALGGSGTQNAAIAFGGTTDASNPNTTCTEEWNGTSWSAVNVLSTAIRNIAGAGSQASAIAFGGYESEYAPETQEYTVKFIKTACK